MYEKLFQKKRGDRNNEIYLQNENQWKTKPQ